jgi:Aspartate-semialdehyde dehydrogenase
VNADGRRLRQEEHHRQPELLDRAARGRAEAAARQGHIKRVVVSTYQSVSGAGKDAMDELFSQTKAVYTNSE